jgi:hypothetical protein
MPIAKTWEHRIQKSYVPEVDKVQRGTRENSYTCCVHVVDDWNSKNGGGNPEEKRGLRVDGGPGGGRVCAMTGAVFPGPSGDVKNTAALPPRK